VVPRISVATPLVLLPIRLRLLIPGGKLRMLRAPILAVSVLAGWMTTDRVYRQVQEDAIFDLRQNWGLRCKISIIAAARSAADLTRQANT
jgi:hypothetical protein